MSKILISHRGNVSGAVPHMENNPDYINKAFDAGFEVEVDVWYSVVDGWWLGHDGPQYKWNDGSFPSYFWCHCKNIYALNEFRKNSTIQQQCKYFWHQNDDYTLTSSGHIWTYPGKPLGKYFNSIAVLPETTTNWDIDNAIGICSDNIKKYQLPTEI
jgi:DNA modification methylase